MNRIHLIAICTLAFSILFYRQAPGINVLVFNLVMVLLTAYHLRPSSVNYNWWIAATGCIISAFSVAWFGEFVSLFANLLSLALLSFFTRFPDASILFAPTQSFLSVISSPFRIVKNFQLKTSDKTELEKGQSTLVRILIMGVAPLLILLTFLKLYMSANPIFSKKLGEINLDFLSFCFLFFTLFGAFLVYNYWNPERKSFITGWEPKLKMEISRENPEQLKPTFTYITLSQEIRTGVFLFILLNLLLLIVLSFDFNYLILETQLPEGITYSQYVHQSVGSVITSIIFAILLILFFFKGSLNFTAHSRTLRATAMVWILLNLLLITSTVFKNHLYITSYGLTLKRLGVYIYLLLSAIGLMITVLKIKQKKSNWYLIKKSYWAFYLVLIISSPINWSKMICRYNIRLFQEKNIELDVNYLLTLPEHGIIGWLPFATNIPDTIKYGKDELEKKLSKRFYHYLLENKNQKFLSKSIRNQINLKEIDQLEMTKLSLAYDYENTISMQPCFSRIRELDLRGNPNMDWKQLKQFQSVEVLNLSDNQLVDLSKISFPKNIEELDLSQNHLSNLSGMEEFKQLRKLNLRDNHLKNYSSLYALKQLNELRIDRIDDASFDELKKNLPYTSILRP